MLLQGVIDCLIETEDGYVILDFKTDRVSEGTLPERAESYRAQLDAYAAAVREICGGTVRGASSISSRPERSGKCKKSVSRQGCLIFCAVCIIRTRQNC